MVEIFVSKNATAVDTDVLGANSSLLIASVVTNPAVRNFMLKNLKTLVQAVIPNISDNCILALADSDASAVEIATALNTTVQDLEDSVDYKLGQTNVRRVWDIQAIPIDGQVAGGTSRFMVQWKLPPKGIPVLKGRGLSIFAFNAENAAFSNGPTIMCLSKLQGGWF